MDIAIVVFKLILKTNESESQILCIFDKNSDHGLR